MKAQAKVNVIIIIQTMMLLRYFRLDEVMGNLVAAIGGLLHDLGSWMSIIGLIIIPYGLIQENFIYPNQFLLRKVLIGQRILERRWIFQSQSEHLKS